MHLGTVCTSFVFINAGTHRRSRVQPLGRQDLVHVALGKHFGKQIEFAGMAGLGNGRFVCA